MTGFDKTRWSGKNFAYKYLEEADIYVIDRQRLLAILKSFYNHFLGDKKQNRVLDLGCGDGILTHELLKIDDSISATLVDGSEDMLNKAKERLVGFKNIRFIKASFQELLSTDIQLPDYGFTISSLAIHHLTMSEKKSFFNYIYSRLDNGGYFINIDVILSPTEALEGWYLKLWQEWITEKQTVLTLEGDYSYIIRNCRENNHYNKLDTLTDQLDALREAGFRDVDCFYKYGVFSMYGGRK
ncbi:MAG: class I SAM-dependent methyltransferase [Peptococcaceae bacterium]|nr:MAG: class I SAM-dependent methyltransferase [Peptococcaceae bacterium]